jgi:predicted nucleic acid-binding protein
MLQSDDMVLEVAVASGSDAIVTFNKQDFRGAEQFGLRLLTPVELLREIGVLQ